LQTREIEGSIQVNLREVMPLEVDGLQKLVILTAPFQSPPSSDTKQTNTVAFSPKANYTD
jgi:hypothetical protein